MLSSAIVSLAMTTAVLAVALPHGLATSDAEWCQGFGSGAFDTAPNFTLAAYDITGHNSNDTGLPLVLTEASTDGSNVWMAFAVSHCDMFSVKDGADAEVAGKTFASEPDNTFASFNLNTGVLTPNPGNTGANVTDLNVASGQAPEFQASTDGDNANLPQPVQVYCAIVCPSLCHELICEISFD